VREYWLSGWFSQPLSGPVQSFSSRVHVGPGRPVSLAFPTLQFSQGMRSGSPLGRVGQESRPTKPAAAQYSGSAMMGVESIVQ